MQKSNFGYPLGRRKSWELIRNSKDFYSLANNLKIKYLVASLRPLIMKLNITSYPLNFSENNHIMSGRKNIRMIICIIEALLRPENAMAVIISSSYIRYVKDEKLGFDLVEIVREALKTVIADILLNEDEYQGNTYYKAKLKVFLYVIIKRSNLPLTLAFLGVEEETPNTDKFGNRYRVWESNQLWRRAFNR